ncbi:hypothetical protein O6P37_10380 [Mycobacterium sp. CPCC 205372]|uniref:Class I SAM-dependent methyltransferase n=1 Tax=Mycobacterium hippophais TaxID=3016340 RepID=A0ABT4PRS6_9MYCO|nr:hypothetical protein [Mycobacterium hippophais]MCZ8379270.1 hypothetical protein [Mycobacterium hippophais]
MSNLAGSVKEGLSRRIGPAGIGRLEYFLRPSLRAGWGGPLNGQEGRRRICTDVIEALAARVIVETGTFRGNTTEWFATFGVPVHSVEAEPRQYAYARLRLRGVSDRVHVTLGDSRLFLKQLASDPTVPKVNAFFYLDAHWNADLPLADEIETIMSTWTRSVIMIDDFAVPGDSYAYDDYGPGAVLDSRYLDSLSRPDLPRFYPSLPAYRETGMKRGCVVLCNDSETENKLDALTSLRRG